MLTLFFAILTIVAAVAGAELVRVSCRRQLASTVVVPPTAEPQRVE